MELVLLILLVAVAAIMLIAVLTALARKLSIAGPLLLVAAGAAIALVPQLKIPPIPPELILAGVLPPLLYSAAVNLPAIEFRRDFGPIAGLSVVLVLISSLVLGVFFWLVIPGLGLPAGIALGAILSPTDAVATAIAKRLGIAPRVVTMLEGESLLNDATALVLLRTALAAVAGSFSLWRAAAEFVWAVVIAVVIGALVGWLMLRLRTWLGGSAANTALSFTTPFLAYIPTEFLNGSGLVAAVVAGIATAQGARRLLTPEQRLSDTMNWRTIELVLEGGVFLIMGLELRDVVIANIHDHDTLWPGIGLAVASLLIILIVRTGYVSVVLVSRARHARRMTRERVEEFSAKVDAAAASDAPPPMPARMPRRLARRVQNAATGDGGPERRQRWLEAMSVRARRLLADIDYYQASPLGWRQGTVIVWGGMRGVVTLAAAQTLPREGIEHRPLLVLVAFLVAVSSLMLQGFTLPMLVRWLRLGGDRSESASTRERRRLSRQLRRAAAEAADAGSLRRQDGTAFPESLTEQFQLRWTVQSDTEDTPGEADQLELRLAAIALMRRRLDTLARDGRFSTAALRQAAAELDADEISIRLRLDGA